MIYLPVAFKQNPPITSSRLGLLRYQQYMFRTVLLLILFVEIVFRYLFIFIPLHTLRPGDCSRAVAGCDQWRKGPRAASQAGRDPSHLAELDLSENVERIIL